ncbi:uncharacterized protein TEOVI_000598700 [Trypanosoma equiperdum]|uniref:Uncharacterized protein n=2 Tax=Trypanozoon TaxID=39700 RepID=Q38F40_TRYB2|nr:hypothetical protein, unlikely [Trypanosoma brucei brucei TREU927]EAN76580.1 hypothetical protein, unlikely [Trypanosoma brucei brucei TREU927]SCU67934.1 hypothetical protein, conserved [Trypanosoma equiperdum]
MGVGNTIRVCFRGLGSERVKEIRKQLGNGDAVSQIFICSFLGLYRRCCFTSFSVSVSVCVSSRVYVRVYVCLCACFWIGNWHSLQKATPLFPFCTDDM